MRTDRWSPIARLGGLQLRVRVFDVVSKDAGDVLFNLLCQIPLGLRSLHILVDQEDDFFVAVAVLTK